MMKTNNLKIRVTDDEKRSIQQEAEKAGLSLSAFLLLCFRNYADGIKFEKKEGK